MNTKFFGESNKNKFLNELEKVLKEKFPDKKDVDEIINSIGQADGIASLDGSGKVPSEQLPSYVDDIIEVEDYAHLPEIGETGKIYITLDNGNQYRWSGSTYVSLNENNIQGIGIKKIIELTQAEYDALTEKDVNTIYIIKTTIDIANGHEYIDLGLTDEEENKLVFSPYNLGANSPEEPGDYYAWGEIETKESYDWSNYKWCNGTQYTLTKYNHKSNYGIVDNKFVLDLEDDAANVLFGSLWKIPSDEELNILISTINNPNYLWEYININNKAGWRITYNINGNYIFLPITGEKRSTDIVELTTGKYTSCNRLHDFRNNFLGFNNTINSVEITEYNRCSGRVIRPVLTIPKDYTPEVIGYKLYKGSILIADSNLPNEIEQLLASI